MSEQKNFKRRLATVAWGALLIWWAVIFMFDPLTIAMGAIGTGLIFLGVNGILAFNGFPAKKENTRLGIIALLWGILDQARHMLGFPGEASFALLLFVIGVVILLGPVIFHASWKVETPAE